jgi:hypothetical protein
MSDAVNTPDEVPRGLFLLEIGYLAILLGAFVVFKTSDGVRDALPDQLGPLPVEVPWFGALGGALISLAGMFKHRSNWDDSYKYWHYSRPLVGAVIGSIGALVISVISDTASAGAGTTTVTAFDLIAFLVGYREESFRELIKRATDLLLRPAEPGGTAPGPRRPAPAPDGEPPAPDGEPPAPDGEPPAPGRRARGSGRRAR